MCLHTDTKFDVTDYTPAMSAKSLALLSVLLGECAALRPTRLRADGAGLLAESYAIAPGDRPLFTWAPVAEEGIEPHAKSDRCAGRRCCWRACLR